MFSIKRKSVVPLLLGFVMGVGLRLSMVMPIIQRQQNYILQLKMDHGNPAPLNITTEIGPDLDYVSLPVKFSGNNSAQNKQSNYSRILCWINVENRKNNEKEFQHIRDTWGKRCDTLLFMINGEKQHADEVKLSSSDWGDSIFSGSTGWQKTWNAWNYVYENYSHKADWFLEAHYESYFVMENLRHFLQKFPSNSAVYIGHAYKKDGLAYISDTPGYILSKMALKRFVAGNPKYITNLSIWAASPSSSVALGRYMESIGVLAIDARDKFSRLLFIPNFLDNQINPNNSGFTAAMASVFQEESLQPIDPGMNCCSDIAIAFHLSKLKQTWKFELFIYQSRAYGIY